MKKIVAILLILCLCPLCAWAETAENAEDVSFEKLTHAIFEANQLDALFSRYESVQFQFSDPNAPDGYDVIWETKDVYFQTYVDWFAHWEKDQAYYEMRWDAETDSFSLTAGYDYDPYYTPYCFAETEEDLWAAEHDHPLDVSEKDGQIIVTTQYDETLSRETMEDLGLEYAGETVMSRLIVDTETYEISEFCKYVLEDGKEKVINTVRVSYGQPEPVVCRVLRAAFERGDVETVNVTYMFDPGTEHEIEKTITMPANTNCYMLCGVPYVYFYDLEQTIVSGWDRMSDLTVYVYTNPDEALTEHFGELYDAAYPEEAE